ncbi:MAG: xanthine dehydrogenase family protein molybdopterin-binding subunit [Acidobacteria bacterium]|nr:xanthine dehydrogenase family protein molybdopterin-binding subunit [Acidobacteriota bacterium]
MKTKNSIKSMERSMTPEALAALENAGFSRRSFLKGTGALIVTFSVADVAGNVSASSGAAAAAGLAQATDPRWAVDSWVAIAEDGSVTAYAGKVELGQGTWTVEHQLVADELYVDLSKVRVIIGDTGIPTPDQGTTAGSQSHPTLFAPGNRADSMRQALAAAREELLRRASEKLGYAVDQLTINDGVISAKSDPTKKASYAELIGGQKFNIIRSGDVEVKIKDARDYTVLGTSVPRFDLPDKVFGTFEYIHNVRMPSMVHGRVVRPPRIGATLVNVDESSVNSVPGLLKVVVRENFVGVVAEKQWQAIQAAENLKTTWTEGITLPKHADFFSHLRNDPVRRETLIVDSKDVDQKIATAAKVITATYLHPYDMHGSIGASAAVAYVRGDKATLYTASQNHYGQRSTSAMILGKLLGLSGAVPLENVRSIQVHGSGCYGINGVENATYDAVVLSQAVGRPVRVQHTRANEHQWENYGPAHIHEERAGLDAQGNIIAWDINHYAPGLGGRPGGSQFGGGSPGNVITGLLLGFSPQAFTPRTTPPDPNVPNAVFGNGSNHVPPYMAACLSGNCQGQGNIKSERVHIINSKSFFWTGPLRAPNRLANTFAHESFMDEVAAAVSADPVEYRLRYLVDTRQSDVLKAAAKAANWETRPSPKPGNARTGVVTGRGISTVLYEGDNGYVGLVAEVEVNQDTGVVLVKRFYIAADSGPVSNPDGFKNQNEGGAIQGMSRMLMEEVTWDDHQITSIDWLTYPIYRFSSGIPEIVNVLIDRRNSDGLFFANKHMGSGEVSITAVAAAIANGVFDATGVRIRQIPFTPGRVLAAIQARNAGTEVASAIRVLKPEEVMTPPMGSNPWLDLA